MCSQNYSHHDRLKIEGYAWPLSVEPGESVSLHISTNARTFSCTVARVGNSREVVWKKESVPGRLHAVPSNAASHGCDWPACLRLRVPEDWKSGYYHVTLSGSDGSGFVAVGEIFFVVRAGKIRSRRLLVLSTNTYNAYNTWGGASFYHGPEGPGRRLSFHRPLANFQRAEGLYKLGIPVGTEDAISMLDKGIVSEVLASEAAKCGVPLSQQASVTVERPGVKWKIIDIFGVGGCYQVKREDQMINFYNRSAAWLSGWHTWERHFVSWAELNGYDLDYATSLDLEFRPEILQHYRLVLSVGHDEYWSSPMRDNLETFISAGGNAVFLSGNVAYWQVRSEDEGTAIVCWKNDYKNDPVYRTGERALLSTLWCHRLISRPENQLTGVSFAFGGYHRFFDQYHDAPHAYRVHKPDHWIFEGTGMKMGDSIPGLVGWEFHGDPDMDREGLKILGQGTVWSNGTKPGLWASTIFPGPRGNFVFNASTIFWAQGLESPPGHILPWSHYSRPLGPDHRIQRITRNLVEKAIAPRSS